MKTEAFIRKVKGKLLKEEIDNSLLLKIGMIKLYLNLVIFLIKTRTLFHIYCLFIELQLKNRLHS